MMRIPHTNEKKVPVVFGSVLFLKAAGQRRSSVMCDLHEHHPEDDCYEIICCYMTGKRPNATLLIMKKQVVLKWVTTT